MRSLAFSIAVRITATVALAVTAVRVSQAQQATDTKTVEVTPRTGLQAPLPSPALPLPSGEKARPVSPNPQAAGTLKLDQPLTIDQAVALALGTNRNLALAMSALSEAEGRTVATRANLGPTLSTNYSVNRANQAQVANLGGQAITIQNQYTSQGSASVSLPLDITGLLRTATRQTQFQEIAARLDVSRVRNDIVLDVKNAFYTVLRDQALVTVAESDLQNAMDRLSDAQLRLAAGTVARYDVLSAQTTVANAQKTLIQRRTTLSIALSTLNSTIGIAVDTPLKVTTEGAVQVPDSAVSTVALPTPTARPNLTENALTGEQGQVLGDTGRATATAAQTFTVSDPLATSTTSENYTALLAEALRMRPEILREDASIEAARKGIAIARKSIQPSTSLGYTYTVNPSASGLGGQKQSGTATLSFSLPLFDAGTARGNVRTAKAQVATAETNRRTQVDTITLEVRQTYLTVQQATEQVIATRQELAQADEAYRLARLRYTAGVTSQVGVSPLLELSNAQLSLSQAQSDYINALYDYNSNRSALDHALGRYANTVRTHNGQ